MSQNTFSPISWDGYTAVETGYGSLVQPFNPDKVAELINAQFTIPPVAFLGVFSSDVLIGIGLPNPVTQQEIDAALAKLNAICTEPTRNNLTADQQEAAYMALNLTHKDTFIKASDTLELGIASLPASPTLANYRAVLIAALQELAPLAGTRFETHFNLERTAQGLPPTLAIGNMTLAQCAAFDNLLHVWLSARKVDVALVLAGAFEG